MTLWLELPPSIAVAEVAFKEVLLPVLRSMGGLAITTLPQGRAACAAAARREPNCYGHLANVRPRRWEHPNTVPQNGLIP